MPAGRVHLGNVGWGCIGAWFSGQWHDAGAQHYVASVRSHLTLHAWDKVRLLANVVRPSRRVDAASRLTC